MCCLVINTWALPGFRNPISLTCGRACRCWFSLSVEIWHKLTTQGEFLERFFFCLVGCGFFLQLDRLARTTLKPSPVSVCCGEEARACGGRAGPLQARPARQPSDGFNLSLPWGRALGHAQLPSHETFKNNAGRCRTVAEGTRLSLGSGPAWRGHPRAGLFPFRPGPEERRWRWASAAGDPPGCCRWEPGRAGPGQAAALPQRRGGAARLRDPACATPVPGSAPRPAPPGGVLRPPPPPLGAGPGRGREEGRRRRPGRPRSCSPRWDPAHRRRSSPPWGPGRPRGRRRAPPRPQRCPGCSQPSSTGRAPSLSCWSTRPCSAPTGEGRRHRPRRSLTRPGLPAGWRRCRSSPGEGR